MLEQIIMNRYLNWEKHSVWLHYQHLRDRKIGRLTSLWILWVTHKEYKKMQARISSVNFI